MEGRAGGGKQSNMATHGLVRLFTRTLFDMSSSSGDTVFALSSGQGKCGKESIRLRSSWFFLLHRSSCNQSVWTKSIRCNTYLYNRHSSSFNRLFLIWDSLRVSLSQEQQHYEDYVILCQVTLLITVSLFGFQVLHIKIL